MATNMMLPFIAMKSLNSLQQAVTILLAGNSLMFFHLERNAILRSFPLPSF
jgi:hypothetical protein